MRVERDMRYAIRRILKNPGFTIYVLVTLIVGFGASMSIFSVIQTTIVQAVPFDKPDQLVHLWETRLEEGIDRYEVAPATFLDWKSQNDVFQDLIAYRMTSFNLGAQGGAPERVYGIRATPGVFAMLGKEPVIGRGFTESDGIVGADSVVVLSWAFFQSRFGGDESWIGRDLLLDGRQHTIIGVLPEDFQFARGGWAHIWKPLVFTPQEAASRTSHWLYVAGRLKDGKTLKQAQAAMSALAGRLEEEFRDSNEGFGASVVLLADEISSVYRSNFYALFVTVLLLLLLACVNLSTLQMTRALDRERPIAIQSALGAGRWEIVRQLMIENLMLGLLGIIPALFLVRWGGRLMLSYFSPEIRGYLPGRGEVDLNPQVLGFAVLLMLLTTLAFGLLPALRASKPNLVSSLKEGGGRGGGMDLRGGRLRALLVMLQITLTAILLVASGLLFRSYLNLQEAEPGFSPGNLVTLEVDLPEGIYKEPTQIANFQRDLFREMEGLQGTTGLAAIDLLPFSGKDASTSFTVPDPSTRDPDDVLSCHQRSVTPDYFRLLDIPLLGGRFFSSEDNAEGRPTVIINQALAGALWPDSDAIGKRLIVDAGNPPVPREIVGVVGNVKTRSLADRLQVQVYLPFEQVPTHNLALLLETSRSADTLAGSVRDAVRSIDQNVPVSSFVTMQGRVDNSLLLERTTTQTLFAFALFAIFLGAAGIYSMMAHYSHQRIHEMGVRIALGALAKDVRWMVIKRGFKLVAFGGIVGIALAIGVGFLLAGTLHGVSAFDPLVLIGVIVLLALIALASTYFPARYAARVDPVIVVRYE